MRRTGLSSDSMIQPWVAPTDDEVHDAVTQLCQAPNLESLMRLTRRAARQFTGADGVTFVLRAGDSCYYADEDAIAPLWKGQRFPLRSCVSGWVMEHRQSLLIPDIYADSRVPQDSYRPTFVKSLLMVPVRKTDPIAAIGAYWRTPAAPTERHVAIVSLLAEAVAIGLAREHTWARVQEWLHSRAPFVDARPRKE